jgi:hypothetical protein
MDSHSDWFWIREAQVAAVLIRPETFRYFSVFFQPRTLAQAAKVLVVPPSSLKYHLDKFLGWGLVAVVSKPRKVYQVVAKRFFIPFQITNFDSLEGLLLEQQLEWERQFLLDSFKAAARYHPSAGQGGVCIQVLDEHRWSIDYSVSQAPKIEPNHHISDTAWNSHTTLHLSYDEARAVQHELQQLWRRLLEEHKHPKPHSKAFSLRLGLTEKF